MKDQALQIEKAVSEVNDRLKLMIGTPKNNGLAIKIKKSSIDKLIVESSQRNNVSERTIRKIGNW